LSLYAASSLLLRVLLVASAAKSWLESDEGVWLDEVSLRRYNYRMPVSIWAGWAAPAAGEKNLPETVTLENQLLLGKKISYCTRLCNEKGGHESH
jgi:hypothetical protein